MAAKNIQSNVPVRKTYNGNDNLLRAGSQLQWTQEMMDEWEKCANDVIYFAEKYFYIVTLDEGKRLIELYDFQKDFILSCMNNRRTIQNTSRQVGKTTAATVVICHSVIFKESYLVGLLANKGDAAREIMSRIQLAYEMLPDYLKSGVVEWNKGSFRLENGSKCIASAHTGSAARGKSFNMVYIDETAFCDNWSEFFTSVFPTLSSGKNTKIIFTSTPNGLNHFYKFAVDAQKPKGEGWNGYHYFTARWDAIPGRGDEWKNDILEGMNFDHEKFEQEFCCVTGATLITVLDTVSNKEIKMTIAELYDMATVLVEPTVRQSIAKNSNSRYKIKTPTGFQDFVGIMATPASSTITLTTEGGFTLSGTCDHKIKTPENGFFVEMDTLSAGDLVCVDSDFSDPIKTISKSNYETTVYDALEVSGGNEYLTNGLTSHNCQFMGSSSTLISGNAMRSLAVLNPIKSAGGVKTYADPIKGRSYAIVADVSRGVGLDYSVAQVIDITEMPYKQVAVYRSNLVLPAEYSSVLYGLGSLYNEAALLIENNDIGGQVASTLWDDYSYENLLKTKSNGSNGKVITTGFGGGNIEKGVRTTVSVKQQGCSILKLLVEQQQLIIVDHETIYEISRFSKRGKSYEAEPGEHDDCVMPLVLFAWLSNQKHFRNMTDIDTVNKIRNISEQEILDRMLPVGFFDDGTDDDAPPAFTDGQGDTWSSIVF